MSKPKFKKGKVTNSPNEMPTCGKCGKNNCGDCLKGMDNFYSCEESGHKIKDFTDLKIQDKGSDQAQASGSSDAPNKNRLYALYSPMWLPV